MTGQQHNDDAKERALVFFRRMVESVGVKRFADSLSLSTRQVNRILAGVQPNPVDRLLRSLQSCKPEEGDRTLDYICQEMGGYFIRDDGDLDDRSVNAVKECAEAIAAISDGKITHLDEREIREAIAALISLSQTISDQRANSHDAHTIEIHVNAPPLNLGAAERPSRPY